MGDFGVQLGLFDPSDLGERANIPAQLSRAFNASRAQLVAHNARFDLGVLKRHGVEIARPVLDALIAQFAVDPFLHGRAGGYGLRALAKRHFDWDMVEITSLIGRKGQQLSMRDVPIELVASCVAADADAGAAPLEVASAGKPSPASRRAEPPSQAFAMMNAPDC